MTAEDDRLQLLKLYEILDTDPEESIDVFTRLASNICAVPISLISLVEKDRQWFKSNFGLGVSETPRSIAVCDYAIREKDVFVVEDMHADGRFKDNPLVTSGPKVSFYAGAQLRVEGGHALGTLCVMDVVPRVLESWQLDALRDLAQLVVTTFRLRRNTRLLNSVINVCAWCNAVADDCGKWEQFASFAERNINITHDLCPDCWQKELQKLS